MAAIPQYSQEAQDALRRGMGPTRQGDWMQTYTGRAFYPMDPHPDDVAIEDIAHALAHTCRFGGHCRRFYSVAQHSVHVAYLAGQPHARWGLMHDAAEAYLGDIIRPLKHGMWVWHPNGTQERVGYTEQRILDAIAEALSLPWPVPVNTQEAIRHADNVLLATEARDLMSRPPQPWCPLPDPLPSFLDAWSPEYAEHEFLRVWESLCYLETPQGQRLRAERAGRAGR